MTAPMLSKGQNALLPDEAKRIDVVVSWGTTQFEVDVSALLLEADGKVGSDADFIFYNQPQSPDNSVQFHGTEAVAQGSRARITIDLQRVRADVQSIALAGSLSSGHFGALSEVTIDIVDTSGHSLARYATDDASTETALVFGEIYRRGDHWKVRAIGQGWNSGLAGLATDFGVAIDDTNESAPDNSAADSAHHPSGAGTLSQEIPLGSPYRLWTEARTWCDHEITVEDLYLPAIRSLFPSAFGSGRQELTTEVQLIPEPTGPQGNWSISIRAQERTIGYLDPAAAPQWAAPIRRIVASGFVPTTSAKIWASEYDGWDGPEFRPSVYIALGEPHLAIPLNSPPAGPYTLLPRSAIVQVTKEAEHFDVLRHHVPTSGHGLLFVTLVECQPTASRAKPHVEVRIDDQRVGQLTPQMSQRFLPMIQHLAARGLTTAAWGDIKGSAVAAEVRVDGIKANEATSAVLDGPPVTIPPLCPELPDSTRYDLTPMHSLLVPLPPITATFATPPVEPPDGSVVKFEKGNGRYHYVAVRRGNQWETTSTGNWGSIDEVMSWPDLAARARTFAIATAWSPVRWKRDSRVHEYLAVVRFTIGRKYLAAINVCATGSAQGDWYTTVTDQAQEHLPFGDYANWRDIGTNGKHIELVTEWSELV